MSFENTSKIFTEILIFSYPRFIKDKIKAPFVGGKSKKFPDGLQIAMFSNACGDEEWTNSGMSAFYTMVNRGND